MAEASRATLTKIEERLGFVPPFFSPAVDHPEILENLWRQTESAYLDNALPTLLKEKLAAVLGRYCEVPYCLVCHTCSLRPLGMSGVAVLELMTQHHSSDEELAKSIAHLDRECDGGTAIDVNALSAATERALFTLASAIYFGGGGATRARQCLRRHIAPADYRNLIVFTSYNRMCHEWMAAHPEVSFELDQRYIQNYAPLESEAPGLAMLFAGRREVSDTDEDWIDAVVSARAAEARESVAISERRFMEVVGNLQARVARAVDAASETTTLVNELRTTADFAQDLLAIVSHDLRNPLSNVLMGAHLIMSVDPSNPRITKPTQRIIASARRAERLTHDLLDFSLARAGGGIPVELRPADLETIARAATDEIEAAHPGRRVVVVHDGDGRGEWDADRLAQILSNLLTNAISHGKPDAPIELTTSGDAERVVLSVRNENRGEPIPEPLLPLLFQPFKRGAASVGSSKRSVGLGLYIVSEIARGHRGFVKVSSSSSTESIFSVHLPRTSKSPALRAPGAA